ncbi:MAG: uroporphyrinogen-III synthase [Sulfurimonas sp. RIFOXYD12_FULL_33_39]|uniref:uroporphyrinogen-III synthase n=1 Tax=unclassified Sulfurimonas TaxID=2623549 RepID=UPI0008C3BA3A|nr:MULTISPECIES: uroporphyrinogen-III synthase [unclassified Sulfurimonas]OHE10512.1 MAG: uroporphyrinogen-III synthase [Sulfurimonas sp. RIFOXYD12_FULL_33_39]OHE14971.1 MAG: uroporphyrinogen-III synthase [Sulfurimonas sp. RIFOXYD2_FULL_34_21]DAB28035.1 MAG TPA: uroporphyrinogen-III synthase [Sulfurimonas sp. UBA10385]
MLKKIYLFATSKSKYAINVKSLDVRYLKPDIDFSKYDYLIVTSKQTVKSLEQYKREDFIDIPALCVSPKTADTYSEFGGKVLTIGDGYGDNLVKNIKEFSKDTKWLYLRAEVIASDFVQKCNDEGYNIEEKIIYVSECSKEILDVRVEDDSTLIFTSPSSIECFLKNNSINPKANVIVIGKTTAKFLPEGVKYILSEHTSIESCIESALNI